MTVIIFRIDFCSLSFKMSLSPRNHICLHNKIENLYVWTIDLYSSCLNHLTAHNLVSMSSNAFLGLSANTFSLSTPCGNLWWAYTTLDIFIHILVCLISKAHCHALMHSYIWRCWISLIHSTWQYIIKLGLVLILLTFDCLWQNRIFNVYLGFLLLIFVLSYDWNILMCRRVPRFRRPTRYRPY